LVRIPACHAGGREFESRRHRRKQFSNGLLFCFQMKFTVYILQSELDRSFYIGFTSNLVQRLEYHNSGKSRYTSKKMPWKLVYTEEYETRSEAMQREKFLKRQRNREFYESLIEEK
jgi:putative endonuclease